jgi:hypothetical protein
MASIQIPDSVAAALSAQAQARGLTLDQYLGQLAKTEAAAQSPAISVAELDQLLDAASAAGPAYEGTYSRAEIYADHD